MTARRGATDLAGVIPVDKPSGMTSHDVVAVLRRATGERRIGHAGTLDPMATGLLLVLVGRAARLEQYLSGRTKTYVARIAFGTATTTLDADGTVVEEASVPSDVLSPDMAREVLRRFTGPRRQVPPAYSAIKVGGVPAYRAAREGRVVELAPRDIVVHEAELLAVDVEARSWDVRLTVSKGTYVRSMADEIGRAVGSVAHLAALRRTAIGDVGIGRAVGLDEAVRRAERSAIPSLFLDPVALLGLSVVEVPSRLLADGRPVDLSGIGPSAEGLAEGVAVSVTSAGEFRGVYVRRGRTLRAETVFDPGLPL